MKITRPILFSAVLASGALALSACGAPQSAPSSPPSEGIALAAAVGAVNGQPVGGQTIGTVPVENTVQQNRISDEKSAAAVLAALQQCKSDQLPFVSVALVDRFGTVQALLRGDNAAQHTIESAQQKAYTAAAFGSPTSELAKRISGNGPGIDDLPGTLFLAGGVPLKVDGVSVAGIGVGGAPDGALDEKCAAAGATALSQAVAK
ncbi:heme-binding protein [Paenarthrobacter sp. PH39-S1]|uniref:GlcG/HbpS family heme-binding protein n=1 Tax=Paenarthrobacter sp. PH39-S1 TaxID=3046204 RepID=UPI0024B9E784|nr:heme-binding protein [Paenarthrobacter sp. PH39-S1]MDJ0357787.1 heme-binding protein [Paenarthrobacter sp. PH39-S1]